MTSNSWVCCSKNQAGGQERFPDLMTSASRHSGYSKPLEDWFMVDCRMPLGQRQLKSHEKNLLSVTLDMLCIIDFFFNSGLTKQQQQQQLKNHLAASFSFLQINQYLSIVA